MAFITIGEILKAQGIKGEIKIKPLTDDIERFKKLKVVYVDGVPYKISSKREDGKFVYLGLFGVEDRNAAELLAKKNLDIDEVNAVQPEEGAFFIRDIIGCKVIEGDNILGEITDVLQYGAADVFEIQGQKKILFPFLNRCIENIDIANKQVLVNSGFYGVAVYED